MVTVLAAFFIGTTFLAHRFGVVPSDVETVDAQIARTVFGQNIFFYGNLDDIDVEDPTRDHWFNTDAGFEKDPAKTPAAFQKRAFPFRIDGVRSMPLTFANLSIQRSFGTGGGRTCQLRFDAQNLFNRQQWLGPTLNPTSTQFGQVTTVALNQMRFFSFGLRGTF